MDAAALSEVVQDRDRIVADGRETDAKFLELLPAMLQFDQLALTERSPIRRSKEDEGGSMGSEQVLEGVYLAVLVGRFERRHGSAGRWTVLGGEADRGEGGPGEEWPHAGEGNTRGDDASYHVLRAESDSFVRGTSYVP